MAYQAYARTTQALVERVGEDLTRRLEVPLNMHLARAGLSAFLERKLAGAPASLRTLVEDQHQRFR